jgi:hypothetical protein
MHVDAWREVIPRFCHCEREKEYHWRALIGGNGSHEGQGYMVLAENFIIKSIFYRYGTLQRKIDASSSTPPQHSYD